MAENLKGEGVVAAAPACWPGCVGWRGGVAGSGSGRPKPRSREPEAQRREAGAGERGPGARGRAGLRGGGACFAAAAAGAGRSGHWRGGARLRSDWTARARARGGGWSGSPCPRAGKSAAADRYPLDVHARRGKEREGEGTNLPLRVGGGGIL